MPIYHYSAQGESPLLFNPGEVRPANVNAAFEQVDYPLYTYEAGEEVSIASPPGSTAEYSLRVDSHEDAALICTPPHLCVWIGRGAVVLSENIHPVELSISSNGPNSARFLASRDPGTGLIAVHESFFYDPRALTRAIELVGVTA